MLEEGYKIVGNIFAFMEWNHRSSPREQDIVHIVAHNNIMKEYFKEKCKKYKGEPFNIEKYTINKTVIEDPLKNIPFDIQNCWSFTTPYFNVNGDELVESMKYGYINSGKSKILKNAAKIEEKEKEKVSKSLCYEAVEPIDCSKVLDLERKRGPKKGGKRTKKNRRSRTRRRS